MQNTTKIALAWELAQEEVPKVRIAERLGIGRATLYRWLEGIEEEGELEAFIDRYLAAKKGPRKKRKIDPILKRRVWRLREENRNCCGQKIQYFLERDYGIRLGIRQVYEILGERYQLRTRWKKNRKRGPVPKAEAPREVIQMDTVDFGEVFAFSGIDIFTKEADVVLRPSLTSHDGLVFLRRSMRRRFDGYVKLIQTDGGAEFEDEFEAHVLEYAGRHRVSRPYRKNEQAFIEAFNRSLRKECVGWITYRKEEKTELQGMLNRYLLHYHTERPHLSLKMLSPYQYVASLKVPLSHLR